MWTCIKRNRDINPLGEIITVLLSGWISINFIWSHTDFHHLFVSFPSLFYSLLYTSVPLLSPKFHVPFSLVPSGIFSTSRYSSLPWFCILGDSSIFSQVAGCSWDAPCNLLEASRNSFLVILSPLFSSPVCPFQSYRIFFFFSSQQSPARANWLRLKKIRSFQALLISALMSSSALCQICCVFIEVTFFSSSKSVAVGRRRSSARCRWFS